MRKAGLISLAFYYFDFKDSGKQDRRGLLSSLLLQLTARSNAFHDILYRLYLAHDEGSRQPNENDLIQCLKDVLAVPGQGKIYIIIDGLDECPNNSGMAHGAGKSLEACRRAPLFVTSLCTDLYHKSSRGRHSIISRVFDITLCVPSRRRWTEEGYYRFSQTCRRHGPEDGEVERG